MQSEIFGIISTPDWTVPCWYSCDTARCFCGPYLFVS